MSLNQNQRQAVEYLDNCLVLACPGSGKTRVLVHKVEHILRVDSGARILVTAFTQDSASEIRKRIVSAIGRTAARKVITGTFHSIALDQLKRADMAGTIIGQGQMREYIQRALDECQLHDLELDDACTLIETAKLQPDYEPSNDVQGQLYVAYTKMIERNNVIDFADMLARSVRLMREGVIPPKSVNYLLTDESQDIDAMQYAWCAEHIKTGAKFTVVGDDDQSIYKFRRALGFDGMLRFQKEFGAQIIQLDTNYRSHSEIIDASVKLIANNAKRIEKNLESSRGAGGSIQALRCKKSNLEAEKVIENIIKLSARNPNPNPYQYSIGIEKGEWAILARNRHNMNEVAMALVASGIPHTTIGKNLWAEQPICLVLALLNALLPSKEAVNKKAGYDSALHFSGIDESVLIELHKEYGDDFSRLFDSGKASFKKYGKGTAEQLVKFAKIVPIWNKELSKDRVNNVIRGAFDWFIEHMNSNTDDKKARGRFQRNMRLLVTAKDLLAGMSGDLKKRLHRVMNVQAKSDKDLQENPGVYLGTFHSSKGLEFDNVWLLAIEDGVIPDMKHVEQWQMELHEEERRLFYVGMTRAKNRLFISCTKNPSSFIGETGIELINAFEEQDEAKILETMLESNR